MKGISKTGWRSRISSIAAGVLLAASGSVVALSVATPAHADLYTYGRTMLVNDFYDTYNGEMWCLSANGQESNSGAGTHFVYLAVCNPDSDGQWWDYQLYESFTDVLWNELYFGGAGWQLSANNSTPTGGDAGTYGAYTAAESQAYTHHWYINYGPRTNTYYLNNYGTGRDLSASASNPEISGTLRVFTVGASTLYSTHLWRLYNNQPIG